MLSTRERKRFTPEEYLLLEERAETRSEYCDGEIFAMTGGTLRHAQIVSNLIGELHQALKGTGCRALGSDMRLYVEKSKLFTYPDILIVCGQPVLMAGRNDTLCDAQLIVEVLSASTEAYDRGEKFSMYQRLPSLQEYILVPQDTQGIESFRRQERGKWTVNPAPFGSLGLDIPASAIYEL
jgi:Uma2 family endonuclease